jgi:hypothetical protein
MADPLQTLLAPAALATSLFPPTSRYHGVATATLVRPDGTMVAYLRRRFVPPPERFTLIAEHTVVEGDRLDNVTARYLGDPEQFWRLCDANGVIRPDELTAAVGRRVRITMPENVPGAGPGGSGA